MILFVNKMGSNNIKNTGGITSGVYSPMAGVTTRTPTPCTYPSVFLILIATEIIRNVNLRIISRKSLLSIRI